MTLCKRLVALGYQIDVIAPHDAGSSVDEAIAGVHIHRFRYCIPRFELLAYRGGIVANLKKNRWRVLLLPSFCLSQAFLLIRLMKRHDYDLVHAHWLVPQGLLAVLVVRGLLRKKTKLLCTSHGSDLFIFARRVLGRCLLSFTIRHADAVTVMSRAMRDLCTGLTERPDKIHVCSMGVDLNHVFRPRPEISRDGKMLVFVGRLVEKKGVSVLLTAMEQLLKTCSDLTLLIIGDGPERARLEAQAQSLNISGQVRFLGAREQHALPYLYCEASIAIVPSIQEGLGLTVIEAMGCECAVVASALAAIKDMIRDRENGLLFSPGNAAALAQAVSELLDDPSKRKKLARQGRQSVLSRYDWNIISQNYHRLITALVRD